MSCEWEPGQVAMVTFVRKDNPDSKEEHGLGFYDSFNGEWVSARAGRLYPGHLWDVYIRPLLVIDPEDREQVERIVVAYSEQPRWHTGYMRDRNDAMQDALRSLLAPPKPDEPQGLGAVVEDSEHRKWVRHDNTPGSFPWVRAGHGVSGWSDIDAVRVLSEGVTR